jgi:hypothetical protein
VGHWELLVQVVMNCGAGVRPSVTSGVVERVAKNSAVEAGRAAEAVTAGVGAVWAMDPVQGIRARSARRTRAIVEVFMGSISWTANRRKTGGLYKERCRADGLLSLSPVLSSAQPWT